jgi:hypothetical protein
VGAAALGFQVRQPLVLGGGEVDRIGHYDYVATFSGVSGGKQGEFGVF